LLRNVTIVQSFIARQRSGELADASAPHSSAGVPLAQSSAARRERTNRFFVPRVI